MTVKSHVAVFPASSVKRYVTRTLPTLKQSPEKKFCRKLGIPDMASTAKGSLQITTTQVVIESVSLLISSGQRPINGGSLSEKTKQMVL